MAGLTGRASCRKLLGDKPASSLEAPEKVVMESASVSTAALDKAVNLSPESSRTKT